MVTITDDWIEKGLTAKKGIRKAQLEILGLAFPPDRDWKKQAVGKVISDSEAVRFIELSFSKLEKKPEKIVKRKRRSVKLYEKLNSLPAFSGSFLELVSKITFDDMEPVCRSR